MILKVYNALSQSVLQYGVIGWGGAYKINLTPNLQRYTKIGVIEH